MDIPEKLATRRGKTEQKQKHNKICVGNMREQTQIAL